MNSYRKGGAYSEDGAVMILLLAVMIPISLLAAYLTIRPPFAQALLGFSTSANSGSVRISLVTSDIKGIKDGGETAAPSAILQEEALSSPPVVAPEVAGATPVNKSQVDITRPLPLMDLDFSLTDLPTARVRMPDPGGPLKVRKPVFLGARLIGDMEITIAGEGQLLLDVNEVRTIMEQQNEASAKSSTRLPNEAYISFTTLREIGIDLRYSPTDDTIKLNTTASMGTF